MSAVSVADDETVPRIVNVFMNHGPHAHVNEFSGLNEFYRPALSVEQIDMHDLGAAVSVSITELWRRVFSIFGRRSGRFFPTQRQLIVGVRGLTVHDHFLVTIEEVSGRTVGCHLAIVQKNRSDRKSVV